MGYYTRFTGSVTGPAELMEVFHSDAEDGKTFGEYNQPIMDWYDEFFGGDTAKWYSWQRDMEAVSKEYPNLLFALEGEGEESGDIWKAWARNGKVVEARAKIVFETPDLDTVLPTPDVEAAIEEQKARKRTALDQEIARLQREKAAI